MENLYWYNVRYISAYDGDTVRFDIDLGFGIWQLNQSFRLYGINAPEVRGVDKEKGYKARDYLRQRLERAEHIQVKTHKDKKGKYGRWLAEIYIDGENINQEMLRKRYVKKY